MARRERKQQRESVDPRLSRLDWSTPEQRKESVQRLHDHAVERAQSSIQFYTGAAKPNKRHARRLRGLAIILVSIAGLIPILSQILQDDLEIEPAWASVMIGLGVACIALDKFFGYSSAWARYTVARFRLETALNSYQLEYNALINEVDGLDSLTLDQARSLIDRTRGFVADLDATVENETAEWKKEFQSVLNRIESLSKSDTNGAR